MERQIATTAEQSARLLQCGVPAESADMTLRTESGEVNSSRYSLETELKFYEYDDPKRHIEICPAFSLSSLLGFLPKEIKVDESPYDEIQKYGLLIYPYMGGWQVDYQYCEDDECHCLKCVYGADLIEACVKAIEWLYANGYALNGIEKGGSEHGEY